MADFIRIAGNKLLLSPNGKLALSDTCCCQHFDCLWACCEKDGAFQCLRADAPMFDCCNDIGGTTHGFFIGPCTETCAESWGGCTDCVPPCSGPCENSEDCAPGCFCVDGVCVESGACCLETQCVIVYAVAWPDCPSPAPSIAGYSGPSAVTPCVFGYVSAEYTEVVDFQNCVDGDEGYFSGRFQQFFAAASAIDPTAVISGGFHYPSVPPFTQFTCTGSLTQAECLEQGGAFHAGKTCEEICCGACDEETPCPEGCVCVGGQCVPPPDGCCHVAFHWFPVYDPDTNTFPGLPDFDTWVGIPNALIPGWTCSWFFAGYCSKYVPVSSEEECAALAAIPELPFDIDPGYGAGLGFVDAYFSNTPCNPLP